MKAAKPNGLNNPGARYRITVESVDFEPTYTNTIEVDAKQARPVLFGEFRKLQAVTEGIYRDVLYYGGGLAATVLSDADRFPAQVAGPAERVLELKKGISHSQDAPEQPGKQ